MNGQGAGVPIGQAAELLGIPVDAVRKRIKRGTLTAVKVNGRWLVTLPPSGTHPPTVLPAGDDAGEDRLTVSLQEQVDFLRRELDARTEEIRRRDTIIAQLTQRIPELPATVDIHPPETGQTGSPATSPEPPADTRPWWRRLFG